MRSAVAGFQACARFSVLTLCVVLVPAWASSQSIRPSVTGIVTDSSGAVLPGVTVEVASPALIERVRSCLHGRAAARRAL